MPRPFDYYVIFAEMRTGSNLLEQNLSAVPGISCHGEAFNPTFLGQKNQQELFGLTMEAREADPIELIRRMLARSDGLPGFRFFHDHDRRVLAHCLDDRRCAKIILTRNPVESYVSLKIAAETGQWKLADLKNRRNARPRFDAADFERHLNGLQAFQLHLLRALQVTGQTAFYIHYEDLGDLEILNGLAAFLGVAGRAEALPDRMKKQNPGGIAEKVSNPAELTAALARLDRFDLSRTPNFEPRRGAGVPALLAASAAPILYFPGRTTALDDRIAGWLAGFGGEVQRGFTQKSLRQWRRAAGAHRGFTVLRHPLARAHSAFCEKVLLGAHARVRQALRRLYKVELPHDLGPEAYTLDAHRAAFLAFLEFLKGNLNGQTAIGVDPAWASQGALLEGFARVSGPDFVLREDRLAPGLAFVAAELGLDSPPLPGAAPETPFALADIADAEVENACRDAYPRDYLSFGFGDWRE